MERPQSRSRKVVRQVLEPGLMAHGRPGISISRCRFRRVFAAISVHLVKVFGLRVVRFQFVVTDRPGRRNSAVVANLSEILLAQPEERSTIEFRVPTHVIIRVGMQLLTVRVAPQLFGVVLGIDINGLRVPVVLLAGDVITALMNEDSLA